MERAARWCARWAMWMGLLCIPVFLADVLYELL
jgi:hypothetical protein